MTIETKTTKSGNVTVKVDGERTNIKIAARVLNNAMSANNNETVEIVNEAGEKFTYGGTEWKQSYTHYHFNNDNGKSFEIRDYVRSYNEIAEEAIRTIANMPAVEASKAAYNKAMDAIIAADTEPAEVTEIQEETKVTIQVGTISINASAVGNGRVIVKVYGDHECAPVKLDNITADMHRFSDIHIAASDRRNFITKGAGYNGRFYAKANVYIFTNTSYGTDGFKKMYKFDSAKEAVRKLARQELDDKIITAEELEILLAADREIERQHQAKLNADREARKIEWAKYEQARHFAEKIAIESKSVDGNQNVFDLLPTVDELNDVEIDEEANAAAKETTVTEVNAFNVETKITADNKVTFAHADKKISLKKAVAQAVETDADYIRIINENGEQILYAMHDDCGWNPETSTNFYWNLKVFADDFARGKIDPKTGERKAEVKSVDFSDEADEPQDYIFSKTLVSSGYSAHNNAHYSKLERIDKECKILGNSEQTNGSIYREVAFYNADHAHSWAVKTADGKVIISGKDKPDFDKIVAAVNNAEAKAADEPAAIAKFKVGHFYKGDQKYGNKTLEIKIRVTGRTDKTIFYVTRDDQDYEFKSKIKLDGKTEFISDTGGRFAKAADEVPEPVNNGDTPSPENKEDTSMTNTKPTATTDEIREACMEAQTQLETKIAVGAPESEVKAVAEQIADFNRQYAQAYEVEFGRKLEPDCINDDANKIIVDAIELLTVVDKDGNEIKPTTPLTSAEMNAAIDRLVAEFDREQAEAQKPLSLADLKAKYDASEDEAERVAIAIKAYRKFLEPKKIKQERQISEQVCASLTADAPQGWAVTFTDKGNYKVTAHGLSAATLDTITAGDFINPKAFFAKFNRTQADIDNERETAIAELKNQREQLQNMRAELVRDFPDETDRLKILDDMIAETNQDIAVFENLAWKPGMFDDKHFNEDKLPF